MRGLFSPRWIISHAFVLAMIVLMVTLGFWQLRRLDERQASNDEIRLSMGQESLVADAVISGESLPPDHSAVGARGTYLTDHDVFIANRSFNGQAGSWLATPLELAGGELVVVVRGFVPRVAIVQGLSTEPPGGDVSVVGLAFDSVSGGRVGATNPDEVHEISRMDIARFEEVTGLDVVDFWIRLRQQEPPQDLPILIPPPDLGDGPHLSYAFQWFFFSIGTAVVYFLILRRSQRGRENSGFADLSTE